LALKVLFGKGLEELAVLEKSTEAPGAMHPAALEQWLAGIKANMLARDLERSLSKNRAGSDEANPANKSGPRL
jgi:hypothetical protein